jgi:Tfp pilus assembly protein FimT
LALAAPSFREMIGMQRLRGLTAQVVTDLQLARAEAASRNELGRIAFSGDLTSVCYTIYTYSGGNPRVRCDCTRPIGTACTDPLTREIRTHHVLLSSRVALWLPQAQINAGLNALAYDQITGGLMKIPLDQPPSPLDQFQIITRLDGVDSALITINQAGRTTVCAQAGSRLKEVACP